MANWPRVDANDFGGAPPYARQNRAVGSTYEPGSTFKAFTVAGALEDGIVTPNDRVRPRAVRSRSPTARSTTPRRAARATLIDRPDPRPVEQRRRDQDRPAARQRALRPAGCGRFGFGSPTGIDLPGRGAGIVPTLEALLGLVDGQPADRPGPRGHADPDGGRLRGDRQRRRPAHAAHRRAHRRQAGAAAGAASGSSRRTTAASLRHDARGRARPRAAPRTEAAIPGYELAGKTGTANKADPTTAATRTPRYVGVVRRLRAGQPPRLLVAVVVDEPQGASTAASSRRPAFQKIARFALPYLRSRRASRADGRLGGRCACSDLTRRSARRCRPGAPTSRSPASPTTTAHVRPGNAVLLRARVHARRARLRAGRGGERAPRRSSCERPLGLGVPEVRRARRSRRDGAGRRALLRRPDRELDVVGITGTNGKTTTAFLVRALLEAAGPRSAGCSARSSAIVGGDERTVVRTTAEAIDLQRDFRAMLDGGDVACAMEVSSHALELHRADAIHFAAAIFTNLTQDHLDFHPTMEDYFAAKRRLFAEPAPARVDRQRRRPTTARRLAAELRRRCDHVRDRARRRPTGPATSTPASPARRFTLDTPDGAARGCARRCPGASTSPTCSARSRRCARSASPLETIAAALPPAGRVPGRFEPVDEGQAFAVLVDYAHTPDSLENVLARRARAHRTGRVICVFGCGGDRDRGKRPLMGADRGAARRRVDRDLGQPALGGPGGDHRRDPRGRASGAPGVEAIVDRREAIAARVAAAGAGRRRRHRRQGPRAGPGVRRRREAAVRRRDRGARGAARRRRPRARREALDRRGASPRRPAPGSCAAAEPGPAPPGPRARRSTRARSGRATSSSGCPASAPTAARSPPQALAAGAWGVLVPDSRSRGGARGAAPGSGAVLAAADPLAALQRARPRLAARARRAGHRRDRLDRQDLDQGPARRAARAARGAPSRQPRELQHRDRPAARDPRAPSRAPRCSCSRWRCAAPARSPSSPRSPSPTSA